MPITRSPLRIRVIGIVDDARRGSSSVDNDPSIVIIRFPSPDIHPSIAIMNQGDRDHRWCSTWIFIG
jgi:hypothetical protein